MFSENISWEIKEIEEQQFVTDYIISKVTNKVNQLIVSDAKTIKVGNLVHLKSNIAGILSPAFNANELVNL